MIKVYHARNPNFGFSAIGPDPVYPQDYDLVATIQSDDKAVAFRLTNSIDANWWESIETISGLLKVKKESRSTSVGDVVEVNGILFRCATHGWLQFAVCNRCGTPSYEQPPMVCWNCMEQRNKQL